LSERRYKERTLREPTNRLIFKETFEDTLLKMVAVTAGGGAIARDTTDAFNGGASLKITTDADGAAYAEAARFVGTDWYKRPALGWDVWWNPRTMADAQDMQMGFEWYDGTNAHSAYLRYLKGTGWQVRQVAAWVTFSAVPVPAQGRAFHWINVKLIADLLNSKYVAAIIDGQYYDLRTYTTHLWLSGVSKCVEFFVWNRNSTIATAQAHWWDDLTATCDEGT
jgi:hypothetical protein